MTCTCGNPDCAGLPDRARIADAIKKHVQFIVAVMESDDGDAPFLYTIGRTERGEPELVIVIDSSENFMEAGDLLNYLGARDVQPGHRIVWEMGAHIAVRIPPPDDEALHEHGVTLADHYYDREVDVLCLIPESSAVLQHLPTDETLH